MARPTGHAILRTSSPGSIGNSHPAVGEFASDASASSSSSHANTATLESSSRPSLVIDTSSAVRGPAARIFAWNWSAST